MIKKLLVLSFAAIIGVFTNVQVAQANSTQLADYQATFISEFQLQISGTTKASTVNGVTSEPVDFRITLTDSDPGDAEYGYESAEFSYSECPGENKKARISFGSDPKASPGIVSGFAEIPLPIGGSSCPTDDVSNFDVENEDIEGEPASSITFILQTEGELISQRDGTLGGNKLNIYVSNGGNGGQRYIESEGGGCKSTVDISSSENPDPDAEVLKGVHTDYSGGDPCQVEKTTDVLIRNLLSSNADPEILGSAGLSAPIATCDTEFDGLDIAWLGCAALRTGDSSLRTFDDTVGGLLKVESEEYSNDGYRAAWSNIRYLATISVVMTAMFMVISTALDFGFFSNYTVKKYIPRLVIGTIAIQLSWVLSGLMSDLVNELGDGIELLLASPFGASELADFNLRQVFGASSVNYGFGEVSGNGAANIGAVGVGIVAAKSLGLFGAIALLYSAVVFLFISYIFLVLRQIVVIAMIVLSPIGVALWILPGSDNAWNTYKKTFIALLMLYPIYITMITVGKIFAFIAIGGATGASVSVTVFLVAFISYVGGYASGPFLAKRSLGALQALTGTVNDKSKGLLDRGRNAIGEKGNKRKEFKKGLHADRLAARAGGRARDPRTRLAKARLASREGASITGIGRTATQERRSSTIGAVVAQAEGRRAADRSFDLEAQKASILSEEQKKLIGAESAKLEQSLSSSGLGYPGRMDYLGKVATTSNNEFEVRAAVKSLTENKATGHLLEVQEKLLHSGNADGGASHKLWNSAMGDNYGKLSELSGKGLNIELGGAISSTRALDEKRMTEMHDMSDEEASKVGDDVWKEYHDLAIESGDVKNVQRVRAKAGAILRNDKLNATLKGKPLTMMEDIAGPIKDTKGITLIKSGRTSLDPVKAPDPSRRNTKGTS